MTGRDLVSASLRLLGVLASGETPSASEATDGLSALNRLIDSWSNESLLIPNKVREVFPFVSSKAAYTMGPGGDFNTTRPQRIENALLQVTGGSAPVEIPMHLLTEDQYANILLKGMVSNMPLYAYAEGTYPLETINFYPVPATSYNVVLYSWKPISEIATLDTVISLPPGYERALNFNLAVDLSPEFGKQLPETVAALAIESKSVIKRMNSKPRYLRVDRALSAKSSVWNWLTGEPT